MNALDGWHPGEEAVLAALEVLGLVTVFVALTWVAEQLFGRRRAALRSGLWLGALTSVLLAPGLVLFGRLLPWHVALFPQGGVGLASPLDPPARPAPVVGANFAVAPPASEVAKQPPSLETPRSQEAAPAGAEDRFLFRQLQGPVAGQAAARHPAGPPAAAPESAPSSPKAFRALAIVGLLTWGLGSLYLGARLAHGLWRVRRLWRRTRPLDSERWAAELEEVARILGVARPPAACLSPDVRSPLVAGLFPPRIVLPETLPEYTTSEQLIAALVHEGAHVVRRDQWVQMLQRLAAALYWVHPLVHLLNRRLDQTREELCDNHVLAYTDPPAYAETLLRLAQLCYPVPHVEGYLTMMPHRYPLERRVAALLDERRNWTTRLPTRQRLVLLASLALLLGAAGSVGLRSASPAQDKIAGSPPEPQTAREAQGPGAAAIGAPKPAALGKITGRVIHVADGSAAGGAVVWAAKVSHGPLERQETVADARGRYTLELGPGEWYVRARLGTQGGEPATRQPVKIAIGQGPVQATLALEERGTFRGRLLQAETGKPLPDARLFLDAGLVLTTDAAGRFRVGGLSRANHEAFVVAPGRMRLRVLFDTTARADTELEVPVPRGGKIVGRVTDADGKPIPGAYVGRHTSGTFFSINGLFLACDREGRFEYDDAVPPGQPTRLAASAPGYVEDEHNGRIAPPDGKPLVLNFRLRPSPDTPAGAQAPDAQKRRPVSGFVCWPDGKPAAGVVVRWGYMPYVGAYQTETDAAGRFQLVVPDKEDQLAVLPRDFLPQFPRVAAGGGKEIEVALKAGGSARGRVLDDTGKPIPGVQVVAVIPCPDQRVCNQFWLSESAVYTGADGKFEVKGVPAGVRFDFLKRGLSNLRNHPLDLTRADNTVTLQYGGAVTGRVLGQDGKPVRSFRILVNFPRERRPVDQQAGFFAGYCGIGVRFTSPDGNFVLTGVGAGSTYRIEALANGHGEAVADRVLAVPINRLKDTAPVILRAGSPVRLRVQAVMAGGKAAPRSLCRPPGSPGSGSAGGTARRNYGPNWFRRPSSPARSGTPRAHH
jgi:beta-lactamase regulating signal transducer with metallopeptidase domain